MAFEAEVRGAGGLAVLDLIGEINALAEEPLEAAYERAVADATGPLLLNFSGVTYMNSTGIALVVGLLAKARKAQRSVRACGLSDHYREIFEITRLADFVDIFPDEHAAGAATPSTKGGDI